MNHSVVDADRLNGWVRPGEMWEFNFCYLNFASRRKLCKNSVFYENMKTVCVHSIQKGIYFIKFCKCKPLPSLTDIHILRDSVPDLNISSRSVTVNTFNWLERIFSPQEVGGGLATGWFVTVANFAPHIFGRNSCGKILEGKFSNAEIWFHVRANWEKF